MRQFERNSDKGRFNENRTDEDDQQRPINQLGYMENQANQYVVETPVGVEINPNVGFSFD